MLKSSQSHFATKEPFPPIWLCNPPFYMRFGQINCGVLTASAVDTWLNWEFSKELKTEDRNKKMQHHPRTNPAMPTGARPFSFPVPGSRVTFLPSRPLKWGFRMFFEATSRPLGHCRQVPQKKSSRGRFWVGLMTYIPAREILQKHKTIKNFQEKSFLGRAGLSL